MSPLAIASLALALIVFGFMSMWTLFWVAVWFMRGRR